MATRAETHAFTRPVPYFMERGVEQTITAPIRHGSTGALVAPTSGTITIEKPDGTELASGAAVTVTSSIAQYTFTPSASEALGEGWTVYWSLALTGYPDMTIRQTAYLCEYVPPNVISAIDLYADLPELKHRIPQDQGPRGDDTGWQPQIDAAYYDLLRKLLNDGKRPWLITEVTGYREWLLATAKIRCMNAIPHGTDPSRGDMLRDLRHEQRRAEGALRIRYSTESTTVRRGGPVTILAPTGRSRWR